MATPNITSINGSEQWQRINLIGELCIKDSLLDILHNRNNDPSYVGLPENRVLLYQRMKAFKTAHEKALRKVIRPNQWDIICPKSRSSDSNDWDIPIIKVVIQYEKLLPPPIGGWELASPANSDTRKAAHICRAKNIRNELKHGTIKDMCDVNKYNDLLSRIERALLGMNYKNMALFNELKHCSLMVYTPQTVKILQERLSDLRDELTNVKIDASDFRNTTSGNISHINHSIQKNCNDMVEKLRILKNDFLQKDQKNCQLVTDYVKKYDELKGQIKQMETRIVGIEEKSDRNEQRINEHEKRLEQYESKTARHELDEVNTKVWQKMSENNLFALEDWITLAERVLQTDIEEENISTIKSRLQKRSISWWTLKKELSNMDREDIIKELCEKTNITKDLDRCIKDHKLNLKKSLENLTTPKPFREKFRVTSMSKAKHEAYVDLAVVKGDLMDEKWDGDEKDFQQMKFNTPKDRFENIDMEKLYTEQDEVVIVSGTAGVGKSTLYEEIKYRWLNKEIFTGENGMPKIDLLLTLTCRELNNRRLDTSSTDVFEQLFPNLDRKLIREISSRVLLIIDGADELQSIEYLNERINSTTFVDAFRQLITPGKYFDHFMITSRPKTAYSLWEFYKYHRMKKRVEVCGFNDQSIKAFIQNEFPEPEKAEEVLRKTKENITMEAMASIPIYLWVLCGLYHEDTSIEAPSTLTELLLYSSLTFLKNVYKENGYKLMDKSLHVLAKDKDVIKHYIHLADLSFKTLNEKKVVFFKDESSIESVDMNVLAKVGFLVICDDDKRVSYQYRHLVFQEIFAALHILRIDNPKLKDDYYVNENLRDCLQFVAGLEGIISRLDSSEMLKQLIQDIVNYDYTNESKSTSNNIKVVNSIENYMDRLLSDSCGSDKSSDYRVFLNCYSEKKMSPSKSIQHIVSRTYLTLRFEISSLDKELKFLTDIFSNIKAIRYFCLPPKFSKSHAKDLAFLSQKVDEVIHIFDVFKDSLLEYLCFLCESMKKNSYNIRKLSIGILYADERIFEFLMEIVHVFSEVEMLWNDSVTCKLFQEAIQPLFHRSGKTIKLERLTFDVALSFTWDKDIPKPSLHNLKYASIVTVKCYYTSDFVEHILKELKELTPTESKNFGVLILQNKKRDQQEIMDRFKRRLDKISYLVVNQIEPSLIEVKFVITS